jgi:hypothetical protein
MLHCTTLQEIARFGMWNLTQLQARYLLTGLKPATLLAIGGWDTQQPFDQYWRAWFMTMIKEEIIHLLLPWFAAYKERIAACDAAGTAVPVCARAVLQWAPYLAYVAAQQALELCSGDRPEKYKDNPVHKLLLGSLCFR